MTNKKNVMLKQGRQKKKKKKKQSGAITNKGGKPTTEKLLKRDTSMGKQPLVKQAGTSNKQSVTKSKRKRMNRKKRKREAAFELQKAQAQINTKQGQTKKMVMEKTKGAKKGAKAGMKIMSLGKTDR
jgi:hypothetical protein